MFWGIGFFVWNYLDKNVEEFRFELPKVLWLLALARVLVILHYISLYFKNKRLNKYANKHSLPQVYKGFSKNKSAFRFVLFLLGISFIIIAWANPQIGKNEKKMKTSGIDIMVCLDISNSMLAKDLSANKNRLEVAKMAITQMLKKLKGDRVGVVVFAGSAYSYIPITNDYEYIKLEMMAINPGMLSAQGTAIGTAIETAMGSFEENKTNKAILIFTDGENHETNALKTIKEATKNGVKVYTIGMGTTKSVPIPKGKYGNDYHKDKNGKTVLTKLNENMLKNLAKKGNGMYVRAKKTKVNTDKIIKDIDKIEKTAFKEKKFMEYEDRFQWFLAFGLLLFLGRELFYE